MSLRTQIQQIHGRFAVLFLVVLECFRG
jgi:hypothetical protein